MRTLLMTNNTSVLTGLNQAAQSRMQLNISRANLLPSLNLSAAIGTGFSLSSITALLPFLLPSNWYNVDVAEKNLAATGFGFYVTELNELAIVYSLYQNHVNDTSILEAYKKIANNFVLIQDYVKARVLAGTESKTALALAETNTQNAIGQVHSAQELLAQDDATLRQTLGLSLKTNFAIQTHYMQPIAAENMSPQQVFNKIFNASPEYQQVQSLIAAAKAQKLATSWSWLGGAAAQANRPNGGGSGYTVVGAGTIGLSPSLFPQIEMVQLNVNQLAIQQKEIELQISYLIESSLASIHQAADQVANYTQAETTADQAFANILDQYGKLANIGIDSLNLAANTVQTVALNRIKSQMDLDNQRITFNRLMMTDEFSKVKPCKLKTGETPNPFSGFFGGLFGGADDTQKSVDELCKN